MDDGVGLEGDVELELSPAAGAYVPVAVPLLPIRFDTQFQVIQFPVISSRARGACFSISLPKEAVWLDVVRS